MPGTYGAFMGTNSFTAPLISFASKGLTAAARMRTSTEPASTRGDSISPKRSCEGGP